MSTRIIVPGGELQIGGCTVYIMNVVKKVNVFNQPRFLVSCIAECYGKRSKQFLLDVGSNDELLRMLKYEISLFKLLIIGGSYEVYRAA